MRHDLPTVHSPIDSIFILVNGFCFLLAGKFPTLLDAEDDEDDVEDEVRRSPLISLLFRGWRDAITAAAASLPLFDDILGCEKDV